MKLLDMTPIGHYFDGSPRYPFQTSFPSRGVRLVGSADTPELAHAQAVDAVRDYERRDPFGNMGEVCGVTLDAAGAYRGVICLYHSNT